MRRITRAAFVPEGSGVALHLFGFLLGSLYVILPPHFYTYNSKNTTNNKNEQSATSTHANILKENLALLSKAKMHADRCTHT